MEPQEVRSILISVGGSLAACAIFYLLTSNTRLALLTLGILIILALAIIRVRRHYKVSKLLGIESAGLRTKEDWDRYYLNSKTVRVFFTRGGSVLGSDTDPMYQNVKGLPSDWGGEIKVLILNPNSKYISDRARELEFEDEEVKDQCRNVMRNINRLREKHHINIKGKYYDSKPFLRFTLFEDFGFFSYPAWGEKYKLYSYHFKVKRGSKTLYEALSVYFDQLWNTAKEEEEQKL